MTTRRKITLGLSYLRSAIADLAISQPSLARTIHSDLLNLADWFDRRPDICGKCYNISRKF